MSDRQDDRSGGAESRADLLYERYKDALRRGHVAALRGDLDEALRAYQEASRMAPGRPMARASAGMALLRAGRHEEALPHFDAAVRLAPSDEATRAGRAQALEAVGRRHDAADDLEVVAEARERAGRTAEALDAAAHALELAEARHRRQLVGRLVAALRASEPDEAARTALAGAMRVLEAGPGREPAPTAESPDATDAEPGEHDTGGTAPESRAGTRPPVDTAALAAAAAAALDAGDGPAARAALLELAAGHRALGRLDAALDACYLALSVAPDDVDVHLALVGLYDDRGWTPLATEKLDLLARLAALDDDADSAGRIDAARHAPA